MTKATRLFAAALAVSFAAATLAACTTDRESTSQTRDWRASKDQNRAYSRTSQK